MPRDNYGGDRIGLLLDTFDDKNTGYYFVVNAASVQADYTVTADFRSWDNSWDGVWYAYARLTDYGYCVEIQIPFRSIRYKSNLTEWGINFTRYIPARDEQSYWAPQDRAGVRVSESGRLFNIKPEISSANLEIYPVALCRYDQTENIRISPGAGLDASWLLGTAACFRLTTNPDFAQIEADPAQINLSKYELWYPERRPFFVEDAKLFYPPIIKTFYSRRIGRPLPNGKVVPIIAGVKFSAQLERTAIGFLDVLCNKVTPPIESLPYFEPLSYYRVLRLQQNVFKNSNFGFHYSIKTNEDYTNNVYGFDGTFQNKNLTIEAQTTRAEFNSPNDNRNAWAESFIINYEANRFNLYAQFLNVPADFDLKGIGFLAFKGLDYSCNFGPNFYNFWFIRALSINANLSLNREANESINGYRNGFYASSNYNNNWGNWFSLCYYRDYEMAITYRGWSGQFGFWTDKAKPLYFTGGLWATNKEYNYRRYYFAPNSNSYLQFDWQINPSLKTAVKINNTTEWDTIGKIEAVSWILRPTINYALTRDLQLRVYSELNFDSKIYYLNFLISWSVRPKSWIYLAFNESHNSSKHGYPLRERIGVIKIRYLFFF